MSKSSLFKRAVEADQLLSKVIVEQTRTQEEAVELLTAISTYVHAVVDYKVSVAVESIMDRKVGEGKGAVMSRLAQADYEGKLNENT